MILHSPDKFKDLYKAVDQDALPKEYGGKAGSLDDLKSVNHFLKILVIT